MPDKIRHGTFDRNARQRILAAVAADPLLFDPVEQLLATVVATPVTEACFGEAGRLWLAYKRESLDQPVEIIAAGTGEERRLDREPGIPARRVLPMLEAEPAEIAVSGEPRELFDRILEGLVRVPLRPAPLSAPDLGLRFGRPVEALHVYGVSRGVWWTRVWHGIRTQPWSVQYMPVDDDAIVLAYAGPPRSPMPSSGLEWVRPLCALLGVVV